MEIANVSFPEVFILLGFSEQPSLEPILFIFVLGIYAVSVLGNGIIIVVSCMDVHLHTPMYFFLVNLSFLDISFTTSIVPQLLVNLWGPQKTISYGGCVIQFCISHWLGATVSSWQSCPTIAMLPSAGHSTTLSSCIQSFAAAWLLPRGLGV